MMNPIISIIIPCFQAENYIKRCLDSIKNQTVSLNILEVIAIDDGSTDGTLEELKRYKHDNVDLNIHIKSLANNCGPSVARNLGIKISRGRFLNFLDIDDWQEVDAYEKLLEPVYKYNCQISIGKHERSNGINILEKNDVKFRSDFHYHFEKCNNLYWPEYSDFGNNGDFFTLGSALIPRKLIVDNNVFSRSSLKLMKMIIGFLYSNCMFRIFILWTGLYIIML